MLKHLALLTLVVAASFAHRTRHNSEDDSDADRSEELLISRNEFVLEDVKKFKVETAAEQLKGQDLVDYVNRKQDLWTVSRTGRNSPDSELTLCSIV